MSGKQNRYNLLSQQKEKGVVCKIKMMMYTKFFSEDNQFLLQKDFEEVRKNHQKMERWAINQICATMDEKD